MVPAGTIVNVVVGAIFLGFWLVSFIILYHLARFGVGILPKKLAVGFLIGAFGIFTWCIVTFVKLDVSSINL
jgi:hypothetical protein